MSLHFQSNWNDQSVFKLHLQEKQCILFFGILSPLKGIDVLAEALPAILKENPDIHVVFLGRDDGMGKAKVSCSEFLRGRLELFPDRLHPLGRLSREQLFPIIQNAHFVVLSLRADNLLDTCLEAQSVGRVVIGTRDSSIDELVEEGVTGFLAENGDFASLKRAFKRALQMSTEDKHRMEVRVRQKVALRSGSHTVEELVSYYENAIRTWKGRCTVTDGGQQCHR